MISQETIDEIRQLSKEDLERKRERNKPTYEELQARIDKAIEYIENVEEDYIAYERSGFYEYQDKTRWLNYEDIEQKLYNILRGEDKE